MPGGFEVFGLDGLLEFLFEARSVVEVRKEFAAANLEFGQVQMQAAMDRSRCTCQASKISTRVVRIEGQEFLNLGEGFLNFREYLEASGQTAALEALLQIPVPDHAHLILKDLFHQYAIIGGMPEVVKEHLKTKSLSDLTSVYEGIWTAYREDIEKYTANATEAKVIRHIMHSAALHLDKRVTYQNFGNSNYRSREVGEALRHLHDARIIQLIRPTTTTEPPIISDLRKSPRLQILDTGLVNHDLQIQGEMLALPDLSDAFKGAVIPHLVTQELISLQNTRYDLPHFWVREKAQSSAEVDLVVRHQNLLIPIEIKSGKTGTLKSLHQFIERCDHPYAVRMYAGPFCIEEHTTPTVKKPYFLMNLPYYLGTAIPEYLDHFIRESGSPTPLSK